MSAVCVIAPIVVSAWPGFSATVVAAAASLGYRVVEPNLSANAHSGFAASAQSSANSERSSSSNPAPGATIQKAVALDMPQCDIVTESLARDQKLSVTKDGVTVTFSRDARGKAGLCVVGAGMSEETLRAAGRELSERVVQKHVHQRILEEMQSRGYTVFEEVDEQNQAIRLRVRHWEN
ncbi:MAG: hypothetical protein RLZZ399_1929 [Verrucomicrobiota bacterium]|jgi:hypothetical protein